jgi:predicted phage terminase large subunit-like protein
MIQDAWIRDNAVGYIPREVDARIRWWDRAATQGGGDYTVGLLMSRKNDQYYIEDVVRDQWGSTLRDQQIRATCIEDNKRYPNGIVTWGEQEPGSAGKDAALAFEKLLRPYAAHCETSSGSKEVRADALASAFGAGEVHVCGRYGNDGVILPDWFDEFAAELSTFPFGKHDDSVDSASGAFNKLGLAVEPGGYASVSQAEFAMAQSEEVFW